MLLAAAHPDDDDRVASLGLLIMPDWRKAYLLGALVCAGLMGYALYVQYVIGLERVRCA